MTIEPWKLVTPEQLKQGWMQKVGEEFVRREFIVLHVKRDGIVVRNPELQVEEEQTCPECDGKGTVVDAPGRVLDGGWYTETCPVCRGTGRR